MDTVVLHAHFDGERIQLNEPYNIEQNTKILVTILPNESCDTEQKDWIKLALSGLENAYSKNEPEYSFDMIKEANPNYEGR